MLKMIIADDEFIVRDGLSSIIPWNEYGIEVIAEAADGQEAYELCMQLKPDILFTDIRMPLMDGLEVAMKLKETESDIRIIIISGVQDFNYAKIALNINAEGYILKPVKLDELKDIVKKVAGSILEERGKAVELQNLKDQLYENMPAVREKFLRNLISGLYREEQYIQSKLDYFNIPLKPDEGVTVAVLQIDDFGRMTDGSPEEDRQLLSFSVSNIVGEIISVHEAGICSSINDNEFIIIFRNASIQAAKAAKPHEPGKCLEPGKSLESGKCLEICEEISESLKKYLKMSVSIGIGRPVDSIAQLPISYNDAVSANRYRFYTGAGSILDISDVEQTGGSMDSIPLYSIENKLMSSMKSGDEAGVRLAVDEIFSSFSPDARPPVGYIQSICVELVCMASRTLYELQENLDEIVGGRSKLLDNIYKTETLSELKEYLLSLFTDIAAWLSHKFTQKNGKVVNRIKEIISRQYMLNLSVMSLSNEVYLSPNYISLIFKKETGSTVVEYITQVRMEAAKKLLSGTEMKILEVAETVGYENPQYFSTVFKKYTGVHPQQFRCTGK